MTIDKYCVLDVDVAEVHETAQTAALRMRQRAVGTLVVVNAAREPVGIVTDRDLMERVLAENLDGGSTFLRDVMTPDPTTIRADEAVQVAVPRMRRGGFRRLPVVNDRGQLVGLISMDDLLMHYAEELSQIGQLLRRETPQGVAAAPAIR